ncbi:AzlD domain-containing protein [Orrella sp. JC864]|uniref:AzlD family protein n=1 Tax=Orrella sp. JC864 TaxID=3120298 RepID=UPI0012BB7CAA
MSIDAHGLGALFVILAMSATTLATRWGGLFIMSFVPIGPRTRRFINGMSGSVLVALLAPLAASGDGGARIALATTALVMLLARRPLPAIAAGVVAAALWRQL